MEYLILDKGGTLELNCEGEKLTMYILARMYVKEFDKTYMVMIPLEQYQSSKEDEMANVMVASYIEYEDNQVDLAAIESIYERTYIFSIIEDITTHKK